MPRMDLSTKYVTIFLWIVACGSVAIHAYRTTPWHQLEAVQYSFESYVQEYHKQYTSDEEYHMRKEIFHKNLQQILEFNRRNESWKKGINHFTDRTHEERMQHNGYKAGHTAFVMQNGSRFMRTHERISKSLDELPTAVDWRSKDAVSAVKDQGSCGSCWAFATAEVLESHYFLKTQKHMLISTQQIASCTQIPMQCLNLGEGGCQGSSPIVAYENIMRLNITVSEFQYPYLSSKGDNFSCLIPNHVSPLHIDGYSVIKTNTYEDVLDVLANVGPVTTIVDASKWFEYEQGVFEGCSSNIELDHAVNLVGYGVENDMPYWIVRNSWSVDWGEKGYIRLFRSAKPPCAVDKNSRECGGGTQSVTVCGDCGILHDLTYPRVL